MLEAPPHLNCIISIAEFLERVKDYAPLVNEDPQELKKGDKRIMSVFVADKHSCKIYCVTKGTVVKSLKSLGVKPQRIIKGKGFFIWDILLPTPEDSIKAASWELITKDLII